MGQTGKPLVVYHWFFPFLLGKNMPG